MLEKEIISKYSSPISLDNTKIIMEQMERCICKIKRGTNIGTGFFAKLKSGKRQLNVLFTSHRVLDNNYLKKNKRIAITLNNDRVLKIINLDYKRAIYCNKNLDTTIIEILEEDDIKNYLEFDEQLFEDNSEDIITYHKSIYILQNTKDNIFVSYGNLNDININNNEMKLFCRTKKGSSGSPILNLGSMKVIGIHKSKSNKYTYEKGIFLKSILNSFDNYLEKNLTGKNICFESYIKNSTDFKTPNQEYNNSYNDNENISSYTKNYNINKIYKDSNHKFHFICKKCHIIPIITFKSTNLINISCSCSDLGVIKLNDLLGNYFDIKDKNMLCNVHKKKFSAYCNNCFRDICDDCILKDKGHSEHNIKNFDIMIFDLKIKLEKLKDKFNENQDLSEEIDTINKFIDILINDFNAYPSSNLYKSIENTYNFFFGENIELQNINDINNIPQKNIYSIIINKQKLSDLKILSNIDLMNLSVLSLPNNNIQDISPLIKIKMYNLKFLDLSNNILDDSSISFFEKKALKYLYFINLSSNKLTSFAIFKTFEKFDNLKECFIGGNKFIIDKNKDEKEYCLNNIHEIDLSNGVFDKDSIKILNKFEFNNLEKIYLNNNCLEEINFLDNIKSNNLTKITLNDNYINIFQFNNNQPNLKIIEIQNNKIIDMESINNSISKLPKLETINLKGNRINLKNKTNLDLIIKIIKEYKIKFIYFN